MAMFPCSADGARYRGPQSTMYPAIVQGGQSIRERLRLCVPHFEQLLKYIGENLQEVVYDVAPSNEPSPSTCSFCGGDLDERKMVFVTAYPQGQAEVQFYGSVCTRCVPVVSRSLLLTT